MANSRTACFRKRRMGPFGPPLGWTPTSRMNRLRLSPSWISGLRVRTASNADAYEGSSFSGWSELACSGGLVSLNGDTDCTAQFDGTCDPLVDLQAQTVTGTETFASCEELRAGNGFQISGGDVTLRAGGRIVLYDGFSVVSGGSLSAQAGPEP